MVLADGTNFLESDGTLVLDSIGDVLLSDGTDDACCCNPCPPCTPTEHCTAPDRGHVERIVCKFNVTLTCLACATISTTDIDDCTDITHSLVNALRVAAGCIRDKLLDMTTKDIFCATGHDETDISCWDTDFPALDWTGSNTCALSCGLLGGGSDAAGTSGPTGVLGSTHCVCAKHFSELEDWIDSVAGEYYYANVSNRCCQNCPCVTSGCPGTWCDRQLQKEWDGGDACPPEVGETTFTDRCATSFSWIDEGKTCARRGNLASSPNTNFESIRKKCIEVKIDNDASCFDGIEVCDSRIAGVGTSYTRFESGIPTCPAWTCDGDTQTFQHAELCIKIALKIKAPVC